MFRQPKIQVEMLAFNSAAVACKKSLDWQALKGCESYFPGKAEHICHMTFQNMAQKEGPRQNANECNRECYTTPGAGLKLNNLRRKVMASQNISAWALVASCRQGALSALFEMEQEAVLPDLVLYNTIMGCCGKSNKWRWNTVDTLECNGHIAKMCKHVQRMHS